MGIQVGSRVCVIAGAGEAGDYKLLKERLPMDAYYIAADGGYDLLRKMGITPSIVIGDMDSVMGDAAHLPVLKYPSEKNETDMWLAAQYAVNKGFKEIILIGALGGRMDHTLGNINVLESIQKMGASGRIYDENKEIFLLSEGIYILKEKQGDIISLFPFGVYEARTKLEGLKYSGEVIILRNDSTCGVSNEFLNEPATITVISGKILAIITNL